MSDPQAAQKKRLYAANLAALVALYTAARTDVLRRIGLGHIRDALQQRWVALVRERWAERSKITAAEVGQAVAEDFGGPDFDEARAAAYLDGFARRAALTWEQHVQGMLDQINLDAADLIRGAEQLTANMLLELAEENARELTEASANLAAMDAARAAGRTTKTWHTGDNARPSHLALNGRTVDIDEVFPNGLRYPRAPGPPQETVNCNCWLTFGGG